MTEPWHDECLRLRAEGLSQRDIATRLKKRLIAISLALNESEEQKIAMRRAKQRTRQRVKPRDRTTGKKNGDRFQTHWAAKAAAPGIITPALKQAAILAFSKHEIDRAELMRRITPRSKWQNLEVLP